MGAGRPYEITAEQMAVKFDSYKTWLSEQYFERPELIKSGDKAGEVVNVRIPSPPDIISFCQCEPNPISKQSLYNYCSDECKENNRKLFDISTCVMEWIQSKQIRGAISNQYNSAIVARLTGLSDNVNVNHTGESQSVNINIDGSKLDLTR
jgi:hypothetical protein